MRLLTSKALLAALLLTATPALAADAPSYSTDIAKAAPGAYDLEKTHASITFKVLHMGFAYYTMRFNDFDANIDLNPTAPEKSSVKATIRPASLDSNNPKMTAHTDGEDFFNVAKHPTISFASTRIEKTGANTGKIHGDLTILGITKPVVLDATFNGGGPNPMSKTPTLGFSATTTIKRSDYGMNYAIPAVADEVHVAIETEFTKR